MFKQLVNKVKYGNALEATSAVTVEETSGMHVG